jgi:hypothetical protein
LSVIVSDGDEEEAPAVLVSAAEEGVSELMRRKIGIRIGRVLLVFMV